VPPTLQVKRVGAGDQHAVCKVHIPLDRGGSSAAVVIQHSRIAVRFRGGGRLPGRSVRERDIGGRFSGGEVHAVPAAAGCGWEGGGARSGPIGSSAPRVTEQSAAGRLLLLSLGAAGGVQQRHTSEYCWSRQGGGRRVYSQLGGAGCCGDIREGLDGVADGEADDVLHHPLACRAEAARVGVVGSARAEE